MASTPHDSDSLDQLQTPEQVELLDAIDKLRDQGLGHHNISLPQLIVCGEQSSGKSSVLEGLTRLRFPTQDGLCTTFATELILRRNAITSITCSIIPGKNRSQAEKDKLAEFKKVFSSAEEFAFPQLLADAEECMSFGAVSDRGPFFEDVLQIRYSGPDLPSLTIVDLPGIIQNHTSGLKAVRTVHGLVESYMAVERSIILAVVSAQNDLENATVLKYVQKFDPAAVRTLGIITKPDTLNPGSNSERSFVSLAKNDKHKLDLGWHAVKNRGFGMETQTDQQRDEFEAQFFGSGAWTSLPLANVGIGTLRTKLSRVLLQHIRKELPSLTDAIEEATSATQDSLKDLGQPRCEPHQQRNYLMEKAQRFQELTRDALQGNYGDSFFKTTTTATIPPRRLRAKIQDLNIDFARTLYRKGHQWHIFDNQTPSGYMFPVPSTTASDNYGNLPEPIQIRRAEFLEKRIGAQVRLNRQEGLLSVVNPRIVGEIFRQQAAPWERIARQHLNDVLRAVDDYLYESLSTMMDADTFDALGQEHIEAEMQERYHRTNAKLEELLVPYQKRELMMYDPNFNQDVQQIRAKRNSGVQSKSTFGSEQQDGSTPVQFLTESLDDFTNCEVLDLMQTYYYKSIATFISNVTALAIENCLILNLSSLLSPELVLNMDEGKLRLIAEESEQTSSERVALKAKLEDLKAGKRVLQTQTRGVGKVPRHAQRPRRRTPNLSGQAFGLGSPARQAAHQSPDDQIDDLVSRFNIVNLTPLAANQTIRNAPVTPPKSPKAAAKSASPFGPGAGMSTSSGFGTPFGNAAASKPTSLFAGFGKPVDNAGTPKPTPGFGSMAGLSTDTGFGKPVDNTHASKSTSLFGSVAGNSTGRG